MRNKLLSLLLALVMVVGLAAPAFAAEAAGVDDILSDYAPEDVVTVKVLNDLAAALAEEGTAAYKQAGLDSATVNMEDGMVWFLRGISGMKDNQLSTAAFGTEQFAYDCVELLKSMGVLPSGYDPAADLTIAQLSALLEDAQPLVDAMKAEVKAPLFMNGMAQPIFEYSAPYVIDGKFSYEYETYERDANGNWQIVTKTAEVDRQVGVDNTDDNAIVRYCVYVETNYDTDGDGKLDLVKALVQLPRAAMEGDYKAATIYEARPYITGCTSDGTPFVKDGSFNVQDLYTKVAARTSAGTSTTAAAVAAADADDWVYWNPQESMYDYEDLEWYDYYLVRGYAVVECGGLGTKGSEGYETCGTDLEIDAFKCVIEWLHGDRVAYTDKTSNISIEADWSNGKVGMTGRSYAGTTQFGLSTTGVAGLETIVPVAGIASWYEYTNSQGIFLRSSAAYSDNLAFYCAGRYLDEADYATIADRYGKYLWKINQDQIDLNGDYANENNEQHWASRNYMEEPLLEDWDGIKIPALIVHGLNDTNVTTKQSDLMFQKFTEAGQNVKLLLHRNGHLTPTYPAGGTEITIGSNYYDNILNRWFSHYLYGENNGIENMAEVTVQDNVDGSWKTYDNWEAAESETLALTDSLELAAPAAPAADEAEDTPASTGEEAGSTSTVKTGVSAVYTFEVPEDITVKGAAELHLRAKATADKDVDFTKLDAVKISVNLRDKSDTNFDAYVVSGSYLPNTTIRENGAWMGGGVKNFNLVQYAQRSVNQVRIGEGYIDVFNPNAGYDSASAVKEETQISEDTYYDYTIYILPNFYTVAAGHTMELTVSLPAADRNHPNGYGLSLTIDNENSSLVLPVNTDIATTLPNATLTTTNPVTANGGGGGSVAVTAPVTTTPVDNFIDVAAEDWYADAVNYVVNKGLMAGVSESSFGPSIDTTRGMIVTILYRLENEPAAGTADFADVADGQYYAKAVAWASANGIVAGYGDGNFGPNDAITREQLVAILYRYAEMKGYDLSKHADLSAFLDAARVSEYAVDAMSWANAMGLVNGVSETMLAPTNTAVRAQVAAILMNFCENVSK